MGLDMYLRAKKYISSYDFNDALAKEKSMGDKIKKVLGKVPGDGSVSEVTVRVGYWRKANAIHKWFVDNVQGGEDECEPSRVSIEQLKELHDICVKVLEKRDEKLALELLPPQSGFFFGGTETDAWYFKDLEDTVAQIAPLLAFEEKSGAYIWEYEYQSSW